MDLYFLGDVFESEKDLDDPNLWRAQSQFPDIQEATRLSILKRVDTIVPGHGAMFHVSYWYHHLTASHCESRLEQWLHSSTICPGHESKRYPIIH